jgi:hypothetical protein
MQPNETLTRSSCEGGSDHTATVTHRASKGGVAPAQFGVFFCVTFRILVSFISWSSQDLCASQGEEEGEDEAEVRNSYLLHLLAQILIARTERIFLKQSGPTPLRGLENGKAQ